MRHLIKLTQAVIVEGKYDKIRLSNIIDATIITTDGFRIFKDREKRELIRLLARKCGIIIMTDSDHAGQLIRRHICDTVKDGKVTNVYLPSLCGKERRKQKAGAEGLLGVEGTDDAIIIEALKRSGVTHTAVSKKGREITKGDLYAIGVSGRENSAAKRKALCHRLMLPDLPSNTLIDALNTLYNYDEFLCEVEKWKREETES